MEAHLLKTLDDTVDTEVGSGRGEDGTQRPEVSFAVDQIKLTKQR